MTVVTLCGSRGTPGATALACRLAQAWPIRRPLVLVEMDPRGGNLAASLGVSTRRGIASLELALRRGVGTPRLGDHAYRAPDGYDVVVAPFEELVHRDSDRSAELLRRIPAMAPGVDILVDAGRCDDYGSDLGKLAEHSDALVLVAMATVPSLVRLRTTLESVEPSLRPALRVIAVGGTHPTEEIVEFLRHPVTRCVERVEADVARLEDRAETRPMSKFARRRRAGQPAESDWSQLAAELAQIGHSGPAAVTSQPVSLSDLGSHSSRSDEIGDPSARHLPRMLRKRPDPGRRGPDRAEPIDLEQRGEAASGGRDPGTLETGAASDLAYRSDPVRQRGAIVARAGESGEPSPEPGAVTEVQPDRVFASHIDRQSSSAWDVL